MAKKKRKANWFAILPVKIRHGKWAWFKPVYRYFESWRVNGKWYYELP